MWFCTAAPQYSWHNMAILVSLVSEIYSLHWLYSLHLFHLALHYGNSNSSQAVINRENSQTKLGGRAWI